MEGEIGEEKPLILPRPARLTVTVLYTVSVRGELRILPYLYTLVKQIRATQTGPMFLVDLGESCRTDWPICRATEGRALLVAMDGMGYDAFYLSPEESLTHDAETLGKLRNTVMTPVLLKAEDRVVTRKFGEGLYFRVRFIGGNPDVPQSEASPNPELNIHLTRGYPLASRINETGALVLEDRREDRIPGLGRIDVLIDRDQNLIEIVRQERIAIPAGTIPESSISSVVEFIESEAAWAARHRD